MESASLQLGQTFAVQPFKLDPTSATEPTELEVTFLLNGVRYQYGFSFTPERIVSEWLFVYRTAKAQRWFLREYDAQSGQDTYVFGSHLSGQRRVWQEATKPNSLYLSIAVQLNSEQFKDVFAWISNHLVIFPNGSIPSFEYTVSHILTNANHTVKDFLSETDISIDSISIDRRKGFMQAFNMDLATGEMKHTREERDISMPTFRHVTQRGSAVFELGDESEGTQRLFALAGPLFDIFRDGRVLVIDELNRSLHTLFVRQLVAMFQDPERNVHGAQLIFTTHDTTLLDSDLLRRDQIWFTEKDSHQASILFPLTEFTPRKNEAFGRGYLSGWYGAVPILKRMRA